MNIVERIKWLAEKQGINIKTLEKTVGLGNATIRGWEKSSPRCDKLYLIAQHFDVSMEWLLTGKEEKNYQMKINYYLMHTIQRTKKQKKL